MTWNLFFGFDEAPLFAAAADPDPTKLPPAVTKAWEEIQATDFHVRARAIAKHVRAAKPDLIGLQEAALYMLFDPYEESPTSPPVEVIDFIGILIEELRAAGLSYEAVSSVNDTEILLPDSLGRGVYILDRDAILMRTGVPPGQQRLGFLSANNRTYATLVGPPFGFPIWIYRGWASVDVSFKGKSFRFVTTHLEDAGTDPGLTWLQGEQAKELVAGPLNTPMPVILTGDFNSDGYTKWPTYLYLVGPPPDGAALKDVWLLTHPRNPGLTWGEDPDLVNPFPRLTQRLDFVFLQGQIGVVRADVVGDTRGDRASSGIWPSDHAGLVAKLTP
jgi:endonuclease/exonuclease/phosphatase family metal-dependent hydrolase